MVKVKNFENRLIVSCQDNEHWTIPMALVGGAAGVRLNGAENVAWCRNQYPMSVIIACHKMKQRDGSVSITPTSDTARRLHQAGANYVAFDARGPQDHVQAMLDALHSEGAQAVADVSSVEEGLAAWRCGADIVATTLAPFLCTKDIKALANTGIMVMAEGGIRTPWIARICLNAGAELVCVGSAITRPHVITRWFLDGIGDE